MSENTLTPISQTNENQTVEVLTTLNPVLPIENIVSKTFKAMKTDTTQNARVHFGEDSVGDYDLTLTDNKTGASMDMVGTFEIGASSMTRKTTRMPVLEVLLESLSIMGVHADKMQKAILEALGGSSREERAAIFKAHGFNLDAQGVERMKTHYETLSSHTWTEKKASVTVHPQV